MSNNEVTSSIAPSQPDTDKRANSYAASNFTIAVGLFVMWLESNVSEVQSAFPGVKNVGMWIMLISFVYKGFLRIFEKKNVVQTQVNTSATDTERSSRQ